MKLMKKVLGVTLLEIMLVLAIAAMVIVMSVRYYQSAMASSQSNAAYDQVQAIVAAADSLAQAGGSYSPIVSSNSIAALLPTIGLIAPWGETISVTGTGTTTFTITYAQIPPAVCPTFRARVLANTNFATPAPVTCSTSGNTGLMFTYTSSI